MLRKPNVIGIDRQAAQSMFKASIAVPAAPAPKRPSQSDFARFLRELQSGAFDLIDRLARREVDPRMWGDLFKLILNDGHAGAWVLGRQRSGDLTGFTFDDYLIGIGYSDTQADYLLGFIQDLQGDRYIDSDGAYKVKAIRHRANLYLQTMRGTSGAGFVAASEIDEEFNWDLNDAVEEHCDDCPYLASQNPWDPSTLYAYPGDGNTACLGNCKCRLIRKSDGLTSFNPVSLAA